MKWLLIQHALILRGIAFIEQIQRNALALNNRLKVVLKFVKSALDIGRSLNMSTGNVVGFRNDDSSEMSCS